MTEQWKTIENYPMYAVSDLGRVKRITTVKNFKAETIMGQHLNKMGYPCVILYSQGSRASNRKTLPVHKLVAASFLPNHKNLPFIDHIDRNRKNSILTNLRWVTAQENSFNIYSAQSNSKSGLRGASYFARDNKWVAKITVSRKQKHLGYHDTKEEAHEAYIKAKSELHLINN